jgi:hypothetical protein
MALIIQRNEPKPPRIIVYGGPGVGKTTFAASSDAPIFIQTEDGLGQLEVDHFPLVTTFDDLIGQIDHLVNEKHEYKTVIVDSLDWLESIIWAKVATDQGKTSIEDIGFAKGYIFALTYWKEILNGLNYLRNNKGMIPVLIAHSQIKTFQSPTTEPYDRYSLKLHPKASAVCEEWADAILYAGFKVTTKGDEGKGEHTRVIGKGERILYTEERPGFAAKNRYNLPPELPFAWEHFIEAVCPA